MANELKPTRGARRRMDCVYHGTFVRMKPCKTCRGNVMLKEYECGLRGVVEARACLTCPFYGPQPEPTVGLVMAAHNESAPDELPGTLESVRACGDAIRQLVIVDDASAPPLDGATMRNLSRRGGAWSRHLGCSTVTQEITFIIDPHMTFRKSDLRKVARVAQQTGGLAYAGCCGGTREKPNAAHGSAEIVLNAHGLLDVQWRGRPKVPTYRTTGFMGAFYAIPTERLKSVGGWIGLPGYTGSNELAMSILLGKHDIPLTYVSGVAPWHKFRKVPGQKGNSPEIPYTLPYAKQAVNTAATFRLLFGDALWAYWRAKLLASGMPESIIALVETPAMLAYGTRLRERCVVSDMDFLLKGWQCTRRA